VARDDAPLPISDPAIAWNRSVAAWLGTLASEHTRSAYRSDLRRFDAWCTEHRALPLRVSMRDVVAYQASLEAAGSSPATTRRRTSALSSFFDFALTEGLVDANPVDGTARPTTREASTTEVLDDAAVDEIVAAAKAIDPRSHALVALLAFDGLKLNEALALDTDHVRSTRRDVSVTVPRGDEQVTLVLDRRTAPPVRRCAEGRPGEPLLTNPRDGRLSRFGADHVLKRLPTTTGAALTANALRRYYVTSSHAAGMSVDDIRRRTGVDDARTTRRYLIAPPGSDPDGTTPGSPGSGPPPHPRQRS
jgi:integrase/recombinase XerD